MSLSPLFARQPIFNAKLEVVGYELLFRSSQHNRADFIDGDSASSHVLLYAFGEHRINDVIGEKKPLLISPATFCSATRRCHQNN